MMRAPRARHAQHLAGGAPHAPQAHLAQEVVVVLVEQHELRLQHVELALEAREVVREHRVEQGHLVPGLPEHRRDLQCRERRIWLGARLLLAVEAQEIRVADQDGQHVFWPFSTKGRPSDEPALRGESPGFAGRFPGVRQWAAGRRRVGGGRHREQTRRPPHFSGT